MSMCRLIKQHVSPFTTHAQTGGDADDPDTAAVAAAGVGVGHEEEEGEAKARPAKRRITPMLVVEQGPWVVGGAVEIDENSLRREERESGVEDRKERETLQHVTTRQREEGSV
jgi:hypothetical protein